VSDNDIKVYNLDSVGVVVDTSPISSSDAALTTAQNAIAEPLGEKGSIRKRPGLKPFNSTAASGQVQGGIGIPIFLGSAGPDFQNPFSDSPMTVAAYTQARYTLTPALGATFGDDSTWVAIDWTLDWDWLFALSLLLRTWDRQRMIDGVVAGEPATTAVGAAGETPLDSLETPEESLVPFDSSNPRTAAVADSRLVNVILIGTGGVNAWFVGLNSDLSLHISNATTYTNPFTLLFPTNPLRADLTAWSTGGSTSALRGRPMALLNGVLYYAQVN